MKRIIIKFTMACMAMMYMTTPSALAHSMETDSVETDSVVRVIGWFNKTDTLEYSITLVEAYIENGDTTVTEANTSKFRITVADSTKNGYVMRYVPTGAWRNDSTSAQGQFLLIASRSAIGSEVLFSTDEYGVFKEITNWKEVYKRTTTFQKDYIDKIYYEHPELYARQPKQEIVKKVRETTDEMIGTKEKMTEQFLALKLLFAFHGKELKIGETAFDQNGLHYYYDITQGKLEEDDESTDDEYQIYSELEAVEEEESHPHYYYTYNYFPDGWPREVMSTIVDPLEGKTRLTQIRIEWISKAW